MPNNNLPIVNLCTWLDLSWFQSPLESISLTISNLWPSQFDQERRCAAWHGCRDTFSEEIVCPVPLIARQA